MSPVTSLHSSRTFKKVRDSKGFRIKDIKQIEDRLIMDKREGAG